MKLRCLDLRSKSCRDDEGRDESWSHVQLETPTLDQATISGKRADVRARCTASTRRPWFTPAAHLKKLSGGAGVQNSISEPTLKRQFLRLIGILSLVVSSAALPVSTQTLRFEVASIKPNQNNSEIGFSGGQCHGSGTNAVAVPNGPFASVSPVPLGRCRFQRVTLDQLIHEAYSLQGPLSRMPGVDDGMVSGGPSWIHSDRFDIEAKAENTATVTPGELRQMLQALLTERFRLKFHRSTRESSGYSLLTEPSGHHLTPGNGDTKGRMGGMPLVAHNATMAELAQLLTTRLRQPVIDQTGLTGRYAFTLSWTPGENERFVLPRLPTGDDTQGAGPSVSGPSLFTALREQLGLRLDKRRVPIDVVVVDSAERPPQN